MDFMLTQNKFNLNVISNVRILNFSQANYFSNNNGQEGVTAFKTVAEYLKQCEQTLNDIAEVYESQGHKNVSDVDVKDGVLKIYCNNKQEFVLNRQTPNQQIWLASPVSGPQRFDYDQKKKKWLNPKNQELQELIQTELNNLK